MIKKRWLIALVAIVVCLVSTIVVSAERSHPASAGAVIDPTCTSSNPCIQYTNNGSGAGVQGVSLLGSGLSGQTKFKSTSATNGTAGVLGNDLSTSGTFDDGVRGLSVRGTGVAGQSTSGTGVSGVSTSGVGVSATSTNREALDAVSTKFDGIVGRTFNPSKTSGIGVAGVDGLDNSTDGGQLNFGVLGTSTNGIGVSAVSSNYVGANVVGGGSAFPALSIVGDGDDLLDVCLPATANPCDALHSMLRLTGLGELSVCNPGCIFLIGNSGTVDINGQYLKNGGCVAGCTLPTATSPGRAVVSYVPTQSLPSVDDFGEATLQNGHAYVSLDTAFANVIDQRGNYLVFITPEGDSRGLYVTEKSIRGFAVHENMGGHSSLAFSYRIVAKPLGKQEQRLPMVVLPKLRSLHRVGMTMPRQIPGH